MAVETTGVSVTLALGAAAAALGWLCLLLVVTWTRRPPRVHAGKANMELPSDPPAVAGLLVNDFIVPTETASAVVLDLAARRVLDLDEVQPGRTIARLRSRHDEQLTSYERLILRELQDKAIDGVVPTEAMTTGPEAQSKRWQRDLQRDVVHDAQAHGLTYNRWTPRLLAILGVALAPAVVLLIIAVDSRGEHANQGVGWGASAVAAAVIALGVATIGRMSRSLAQLPTEQGLAASARSAGLAAHLRDDDLLTDLPPAAVKVRGRHLAYAAAFGLAPLAVGLLPMGAEDDRRAWSRVGDRWRRVYVRYPRAWPPAWGKHPAFATLLALVWGAGAALALWGLGRIPSSDPPGGVSANDWRWVERGALVLVVPFVVLALWAAFVLLRAVPDFWSTRQILGEIVRDRRRRQWLSSGDDPKYWNYLAIDDGTSDRIQAFRLRESVWREHEQGEHVTADVTPGLGYVRSINRS